MNKGEVWFVEFPLEEDESKSINRPVVVLDENILGVLSVKITKHKARKEDPYDTPIIYWEEAGLRLASTCLSLIHIWSLKRPRTFLALVFVVLYAALILYGLGSMSVDFGLNSPEGIATVLSVLMLSLIHSLKNAAKLNEIGGRLAEEYGIPYLYSDFKKRDGYKRSTVISAEYGMYRQDYCGCVFSKREREEQKRERAAQESEQSVQE